MVATRDRRDSLGRALDELAALPERPPVVVVDNGSADGTPGMVAERFPGVTLVELGRNAGAAARTRGALAARTPYVAFSDDDSWWAPGALARAAEVLDAHPRLAVVAARVLVGPEGREDPVCAAMAASPLPRRGGPGPAVLGFVACGAVARRAAYLGVGGFEERFGVGGEEELLAADLAAAGWGLAYVEEVVAHHHPAPRDDDGAARRRAQARNALWFAWLRRPARAAVPATARALRAALTDPAARRGLADAAGGLRWALARRRPVDRRVERWLAALDRA
ncbi:glycosyltransferase family 2 protein [Miltoncostaea marina]|uniref:glycosyltransferase family 2 protein n=1 Tax=Miltoncostaea marina TaxID=2843215 RepID=UPI001C3D5549|nr:glycosyltransferase family 2 protein [Miltoncostaea marina]